MAVNPERVYEMAEELARGVLAFCEEAAPDLAGGGLGYTLAAVAADAQALLDAVTGPSDV